MSTTAEGVGECMAATTAWATADAILVTVASARSETAVAADVVAWEDVAVAMGGAGSLAWTLLDARRDQGVDWARRCTLVLGRVAGIV